MSEYTKGPWVLTPELDVLAENGLPEIDLIAEVNGNEANARLISASPDLLLAANLAVIALTEDLPPAERARAVDELVFAIRKAEGGDE